MQNLRTTKPPTSGQSATYCFENCTYLAEDGNVTQGGCIIVKDGRIFSLGRNYVNRELLSGATIIDATDFVVVPGLINAHTHSALTYLRSQAHDRPRIIEDLFFRTEAHLTPELIAPLAYGYLYDGLLSGVTYFGDHYYYIEGIAEALKKFGLRGAIAETIGDCGTAFPDANRWARAKKAIENWSYPVDQIKPVVGPHAADTVSEPLLRQLAEFASYYKLPLHMHLSQTEAERHHVQQREGCSPVAFAKRCGVLGPNSLLAHLVSANEHDLDLIDDSGATAVFCPSSQIFYEKLAPIVAMLDREIPVCIANDCAASNDGCDLIAETKIAALLIRHLQRTSTELTPGNIFRMITKTPAQVFGVDHQVGAIAEGYFADLVFVKDDLTLKPSNELITSLIYSSGSRQIQHVMVDGCWKLWNRELVDLDYEEIETAFNTACKTIYKRAGINL